MNRIPAGQRDVDLVPDLVPSGSQVTSSLVPPLYRGGRGRTPNPRRPPNVTSRPRGLTTLSRALDEVWADLTGQLCDHGRDRVTCPFEEGA
jgi:hypothetical protein